MRRYRTLRSPAATTTIATAALTLALLLPAIPSSASARYLSATERRVAAAVAAHNAEALALLHRIVEINSGTVNFAGVRAVADALTPELRPLGITTRWIEGASWNRAGTWWPSTGGQAPDCCSLGTSIRSSRSPASSSNRL